MSGVIEQIVAYVPGPPGPKGDKGDTGDQGIQGVPGPQGISGVFILGAGSISGNYIAANSILQGHLAPGVGGGLTPNSVSGNYIAAEAILQGHVASGYVDLFTNQTVSGAKLFNTLRANEPIIGIDVATKNYVDNHSSSLSAGSISGNYIAANSILQGHLATGIGQPAGSNAYIQYNDNGVFGADANFYTNKSGTVNMLSAILGNGSNNLVLSSNISETSTSPTSYSNNGGSGDRQSIITITSSGILAGTAGKMVDGITAAQTINYWSGGAATGAWILFDFGVGANKVIDEIKYYQQNASQSHGTWKWQGSNNGVDFTDIGSTFTLGGVTTQTITTVAGNTTPYRYYRMLGTAGTTSAAVWIYEFEFKITTLTTYSKSKISVTSGLGILVEDAVRFDIGSGVTIGSLQSDIIPSIHNTYSLGSANSKMKDINFEGTLNFPNSFSLTSGTILQGGSRFIHNYGVQNLFIGKNAGNFNFSLLPGGTEGNLNLGIGENALTAGTKTQYSVALGANALLACTEGVQNFALGYGSLAKITTGSLNVGIGAFTLKNSLTGAYNVAIGSQVLQSIDDSGSNSTTIGIGTQAFTSALRCTQSVGIGDSVGYNIPRPNLITAIGYKALYTTAWTSANTLTAIGANALGQVAYTYNAVAIGEHALYGAAGGEIYNTVAIGDYAGASHNNSSTNGGVYIGYNAGRYETGIGKLFIDNQGRTNEATARTDSLIYGIFSGLAIAQQLHINGIFFPISSISGTPAYVEGGMYYDNTLKKLRIGGASGWETVTSV